MDSETIETVTEWSSEPYSGGYGGLHELAEREFTGAVTDGTAWLFALNGRVVGVADGTIESFADADGTAYAAPDPSLPLLFAMRERGGETRAKYYTNDTPLSEADQKLTAGNFTGFVELSENVLSGDYYVVYHGGRRLACAFVGTQRDLLTDDEAFERADGEVGIYEVRTVDVDVVEVPEPEASSSSDANATTDTDAGTAASTGADTGAAAAIDEAEERDDTDGSGGAAPGSVTIDSQGENGDTVGEQTAPSGSATAETADATTSEAGDSTASPAATDDDAESGDASAVDTGGAESTEADETTEPGSDGDTDAVDGESEATSGGRPPRREESKERKRQRDAEPTDAVAASESDPFSAEEQWRETTAIPSLDPEETRQTDSDGSAQSASTTAETRAAVRRRNRSEGGGRSRTGADGSAGSSGSAGTSTGSASTAGSTDSATDDGEAAETATLQRDLQRARSAHEEVAEELTSTREELSGARTEIERLTEENQRLEGRIETLQSDLADARSRLSESGGSTAAAGGQSISPSRALEGTNLFVRYESKGAGTLEKVHAGNATREEVDENLRLEVHTEFDAGDAAVGGTPFGEWLEDTIEYGFVEWVVRTLLYEIEDTGSQTAMRTLYDAIPKIDRAELDAVVDLVDDQGKKSEERSFDVVLRDRMGDPLVVANVTDSRNATTESMLDGLVEGASSVADQTDGLASAFHVTSSFFEPGALEAVADATGGGLLNRGKNKSFVKLSRKRGFHLCLVESRDGEFHVNVPEL